MTHPDSKLLNIAVFTILMGWTIMTVAAESQTSSAMMENTHMKARHRQPTETRNNSITRLSDAQLDSVTGGQLPPPTTAAGAMRMIQREVEAERAFQQQLRPILCGVFLSC